MAFQLDPNTLYTRADLIDALSKLGMDADNFIARIKPARRFKQVYLGQDLIDAMHAAPILSDSKPDQEAAPVAEPPSPPTRKRPVRRKPTPILKTPGLDAIIANAARR